jgi:predicted metal-dependent hydrolase
VSQENPSTLEPLEETVPAEILKAEVAAWARRIGVEPKEVHLRPMKRKWASCSSNGRLTFNTHLLKEPASFRREVIVHELLHLKIPNHGKVFKALLRGYLSRSLE